MSDQHLHPPAADGTPPGPSVPWLQPAAIASALADLDPRPGDRPVLLTLHLDTGGALVAIDEDVDPGAWDTLGHAGTLGWLAGGLARNPWPPPDRAGFGVLAPANSAGLIGWAADRHGGVYRITPAAGDPLNADWPSLGPDRRPGGLPLIARAVSGLALAAAGHHPAAPRTTPAPVLLVGGDRQLLDDLGIRRYEVVHYPTRTPPLDAWADAPLVLVTPDGAERCRDLPLRPDVVYLRQAVTGENRRQVLQRLEDLDAAAIIWPGGPPWELDWLLGGMFGR